jgi:predicted small lipoprotein YifL
MMLRRLPLLVTAALTILTLVSVPGCGVRGSLDAPKGQKTDTGGATPGKPGEPVPHKPSILDPLIR